MGTVNTCNAACHFCPYPTPENTRPKGVMSMELYRKILDEAKDIPQIVSIAFSALGEPLLDRFLVERVKYAWEVRKDWETIELYTNGVGLTPAKFEALRDAGIKDLSISLNAVDQRQHEAVMGLKGKFNTVFQNAQYAIANGQGKTRVLVKAVRNDDQFKEADQVKFYMQWGIARRPDIKPGNGDIVLERNWAGKNRLIEELDPNSTCARALEQISVLWDGKVSLCCFDPLLKHDLGDLNKQTIKEIYNAPWYTQFREDHFNNQAAKYELCANCTRV
jgi:hypothetical protein